MQLFNGAKGFTVSGLSEAELLIDHGIHDIIVAYPVVGEKIDKLFSLHKKSDRKLSCIVDSEDVAREISSHFVTRQETIKVFMKVDVGLTGAEYCHFQMKRRNLLKRLLICRVSNCRDYYLMQGMHIPQHRCSSSRALPSRRLLH